MYIVFTIYIYIYIPKKDKNKNNNKKKRTWTKKGQVIATNKKKNQFKIEISLTYDNFAYIVSVCRYFTINNRCIISYSIYKSRTKLKKLVAIAFKKKKKEKWLEKSCIILIYF